MAILLNLKYDVNEKDRKREKNMREKFKIMVDKTTFNKKPKALEIALIQNRFKEKSCIEEITVKELFDYIGKGYTICCQVSNKGALEDNFICQQLFMVDVDNKDDKKIVTIEDSLLSLEKKGISALGYYETFSHSSEMPRFRLVFLLDKPLDELSKARLVLKTLSNNIENADSACINSSRLFFGTNGLEKNIKIYDEEATISFEDIVDMSINDTIKTTMDTEYFKDDSLKNLVDKFSLLDYMSKENEIERDADNITHFRTCTVCNHKGCLKYYKKTNSFFCFGENGRTGGNIINYLMVTKQISKREAIEYFKYDLCNLERVSNTSLPYIENTNFYIENVKNQLFDNGLNPEKITDLYWIQYKFLKSGDISKKVLCPELSDFIRKNVEYIFLQNNKKEKPLRYFYKNGYYALLSDDDVASFIKMFIPLSFQKMAYIREVRDLLYTDANFVDSNLMNADENIINFNNGVLHLDTGELKKHSPAYISSIRIPCDYYEQVDSPDTHYFDNFINTLTDNDQDLKNLLLQIMGVVISNVKGYRMKKAIIMFGEGNTGKSVLKKLLGCLIGIENYSSIDLNYLEARFGTSALLDKRLVGSNDMSYMTISELKVFKQATGGDPIHAEFKGENSFNLIFNGILWFCANKLPKFGGDRGSWVYDRIIAIECKNVIPEERQDKKLIEHLLEEKDYIISLLVKALQKVITNGYKYDIPDSCISLNNYYKIENNSFLQFMEECTIERDVNEIIKDNCTKGKIFDVYVEWYKENIGDSYYERKKAIKTLLQEINKGETKKANGGNVYYKFFTLKEEVKEYYSGVYGYEKKCTYELEDLGFTS